MQRDIPGGGESDTDFTRFRLGEMRYQTKSSFDNPCCIGYHGCCCFNTNSGDCLRSVGQYQNGIPGACYCFHDYSLLQCSGKSKVFY